jgi:hypothetical protein
VIRVNARIMKLLYCPVPRLVIAYAPEHTRSVTERGKPPRRVCRRTPLSAVQRRGPDLFMERRERVKAQDNVFVNVSTHAYDHETDVCPTVKMVCERLPMPFAMPWCWNDIISEILFISCYFSILFDIFSETLLWGLPVQSM